MSRVYLPSSGPEGWRPLLGKPDLHWAIGRSARSAAHCWEAQASPPAEIAAVLRPHFGEAELLLAIPEHKTPLPGAARGESQSDVFALVRGTERTIACTVEAKVDEPFDKLLSEWLANASPGKHVRLRAILGLLGLAEAPLHVRYQLLHRTAAAVIEAERFKTDTAAMIVHSFSADHRWHADFAAFADLFGVRAEPGEAVLASRCTGRPLYLGWAVGDRRYCVV